MPIKNLTDNVIPRFPRLGKLRKGGEKPQVGNKPGKELNYFRFTSENPAIVAAFHEAYGNQPAMLRVYLPYPSTEMNFATWKEAWAAGGLVHRCDGETCTIWRTPDGKYSQQPKPCPGGCKEVGRLEVILPELITAGFVGYVTLETHSLHDLMNITATLEAVRQSTQDRPHGLQGIEFVLRRKKERISTPGEGGKRVTREKWLVSIEPVPSWAQTYLAMASSTLAIEAPRVDMLTGEVMDGDEDDEDSDVIEGVATEPQPANGQPVRGTIDLTDANKQMEMPPGAETWIDWRGAMDAKAWAMTQGKFNGQQHMERGYEKVKNDCQPANAQAMWICWYEYVMAHEPAKAAKAAQAAGAEDADGWQDVDENGVDVPLFA
jgi:hypothetical protein